LDQFIFSSPEDRISKIEQLAARIDTAQWTLRGVLEALEKSRRSVL
jgi:hypothetical protein